MEIKIFEEKEKWNQFLDQMNYLSFLQDFEYGEIEKSLKREVIRLGLFANDLVGVCQLIGYKSKRGKGIVVHHGPVIKNEYFEEGLKMILDFVKKNFKNYDFLRINPINTQGKEIFLKLGFHLAPTFAVTENFWIKEIKDDEEMLKEMSKNHRQKVLDSLKKPYLEIFIDEKLEYFEKFWEIYEDLAKRKKFIPYSKEFLEKELEFFKNKAKLFIAKAEGKIYGGAIIVFSHQIAFYHHSASIPIKEPLEYKLQWTVIQKAKKLNCKYYNFWGIAKNEKIDHPWYGLSQFKKGFGGKKIDLLPTFDYNFSLRYYLIYLYEKIKRRKF